MTFRAVETLKSVALVLAEDTRHSRHLLDRYGIETPMEAYHEHNEARATPRMIQRLRSGDSLALISDAGTPLISDPGSTLVQAAAAEGIPVVPIPGASAALAALVASGLDTSRFIFLGFLPRKGRERREALDSLIAAEETCVLYEAPARLAETLAELVKGGGEGRDAVVARELTKEFEEFRRGTVEELARYYSDTPVRGEVVIVVSGRLPETLDEAALRERAYSLRASGATARDVARTLVAETGAPRNLAYRLAQET
ncbi:MAG: 16S rRNA (cytidine(1402)-2'-O)-methyltransferase [Anaerolineae bacterium]|nr:16S rRNA (cytidine(1402)-2'-O)-methyltransferase [Gemmatimonadaceae bacterium]